MTYKKEYDFAKKLAQEGGDFAQKKQEGVKVSEKNDKSLVTEIDIAVERKIITAIQEQFPHDTILAEESQTNIATKEGRIWSNNNKNGWKPIGHIREKR